MAGRHFLGVHVSGPCRLVHEKQARWGIVLWQVLVKLLT
jgi:hypothetical protein